MKLWFKHFHFSFFLSICIVIFYLFIWKDQDYLLKPHQADPRVRRIHERWKRCVKSKSQRLEFDAQKYNSEIWRILTNCSTVYSTVKYQNVLNQENTQSSMLSKYDLPDSLSLYFTGSPLENENGENACLIWSEVLSPQWSDVDNRSVRNGLTRILIENEYFLFFHKEKSILYLLNFGVICNYDRAKKLEIENELAGEAEP
ncbi:unnamed protein product [Auanema sp. JU1783]|nr:unnamed protein product [Auanema sp. JU1783]